VRFHQKNLFKKTSFVDEILKNPGIPWFKSNVVDAEGQNHYQTLVKILTNTNNPTLWQLLSRGKKLVNVNTAASHKYPLTIAVEAQSLPVTEALLKLGANIEQKEFLGTFAPTVFTYQKRSYPVIFRKKSGNV
jgi:hypothetical protein